MALPLFMLTLFVSAFLLFLVQPMIGKMILPRLGGTPQVWNTCMVFFQAALLAGYAYTHTISTRLKIRTQMMVHGALLTLPILLFIFGTIGYNQADNNKNAANGQVAANSSESNGETSAKEKSGVSSFFYAAKEQLNPIYGGNPIPMTLGWLALVVGLPFFVVATSAPLLQKWFWYTGHPTADDPYFLYGASNIGSFAALLAYPFVLEWTLLLDQQSWAWVGGYCVLVLCIGACLIMVWKAPRTVRLPVAADKATEEEKAPAAETDEVTEEVPAATEEEQPEPEKETGVKAGPAPKKGGGGGFKKGRKRGGKRKGHKPGLDSGKKQMAGSRKTEDKRDIKPLAKQAVDDTTRLGEVTPFRRFRWIALTAIPSSLMLGCTTYITTDVSPIPLLWILPLTLYLLSFVLVFLKWPFVWVGVPHRVFVIAQPVAVAVLILALYPHRLANQYIEWIIGMHIVVFFWTTMVCHGELAKDRPRAENLTEFYLMMSVGGVLGGMFNALLAPIVFKSSFITIIEYVVAIVVANGLRPILVREGIIERLFSLMGDSGAGHKKSIAKTEEPGFSTAYYRDIGFGIGIFIITLGLMYLLQNIARGSLLLLAFIVPLALSLLLMGRPLRYALAIGSIVIVLGLVTSRGRGNVVFETRTYFGVIRVVKNSYGNGAHPWTTLMHATTDHGQNFMKPPELSKWFETESDFSRLATTYYHRRGPAGVVMSKYDWFPGPPNTYRADVRMPASLIGFGAQPLSYGNLPVGVLADLWSEPPFATIGLGTGTMASYARPFQHMHYYEIDTAILRLSAPKRFLSADTRKPTDTSLPDKLYRDYLRVPLGNPQATYFTYLADAKKRAVNLWVFMGDARLRMAHKYQWDSKTMSEQWNNAYSIRVIDGPKCGGPEKFYHMMVVDAFSSDAIPVHLLTREAIQMYFTRLVEEGILCVHVSNRHLKLELVVAAIANELKYAYQVGNDRMPTETDGNTDLRDRGRTISTWVMVARKEEYFSAVMPRWGEDLQPVKDENGRPISDSIWSMIANPPDYQERIEAWFAKPGKQRPNLGSYWSREPAYRKYIWTDDFSNVLSVFNK